MIYFIVAAALAMLAGLAVTAWLLLRRPPRVVVAVARAAFENERPALERLFFNSAAASGKPRRLRWKSCEFGNDVELARDKRSVELLALVPVTIAFEAIPGSDMEGLPAVGNLRSATAVFVFRAGRWTTSGRALFNLSPPEALRHFRNQYEPVAEADADAAGQRSD